MEQWRVYLSHGIINLLELLIMISWVSQRLDHDLLDLWKQLNIHETESQESHTFIRRMLIFLNKRWNLFIHRQNIKYLIMPCMLAAKYNIPEEHLISVQHTPIIHTFITVSNMGMRTNLMKPIWAVGLVTLSLSIKGATGRPSDFSLSLWAEIRMCVKSLSSQLVKAAKSAWRALCADLHEVLLQKTIYPGLGNFCGPDLIGNVTAFDQDHLQLHTHIGETKRTFVAWVIRSVPFIKCHACKKDKKGTHHTGPYSEFT